MVWFMILMDGDVVAKNDALMLDAPRWRDQR
jgi:hypothetical protein